MQPRLTPAALVEERQVKPEKIITPWSVSKSYLQHYYTVILAAVGAL